MTKTYELALTIKADSPEQAEELARTRVYLVEDPRVTTGLVQARPEADEPVALVGWLLRDRDPAEVAALTHLLVGYQEVSGLDDTDGLATLVSDLASDLLHLSDVLAGRAVGQDWPMDEAKTLIKVLHRSAGNEDDHELPSTARGAILAVEALIHQDRHDPYRPIGQTLAQRLNRAHDMVDLLGRLMDIMDVDGTEHWVDWPTESRRHHDFETGVVADL